MVRLQDLKAKILSIPDKRLRSDLVGKLRIYNEKMKKSRVTLEKAVNSHKQSFLVFPEGEFSVSVATILKAASNATTLVRRLIKNPNTIKNNNTEITIGDISNFAETSLKELRSQWKKSVLGKTQTFQSIAKAAKDAKLKGGDILQNLLDSIVDQANSPPMTFDQAETIKKQLDDMLKVITDLGLEGDVLDFLLGAAKGTADPKALYKPAIKEFVERHDLWQSLRVSLS